MKKLILILFLISTSYVFVLTTVVHSNSEFRFKCKSEKGFMEWRYDKKYLYEVYAQDDIRKYEIENKDIQKLFARSKSKNGVWYAVFDFNKSRVDVQGPFGQYSNIECKQIG